MKSNRSWPVLPVLLLASSWAIAQRPGTQAAPTTHPAVKLSDAPKTYQDRCVFCHETNVGPSLRGRGLDPGYVKLVLRNGSRAMPQFRATEVSEQELAQLTAYLAELDAAPPRPQETSVAAGDAKRGEAVYQKICVTCHGPKGRADGIVAMALKPPVIDFKSLDSQKKLPAELLQVIENGKPGSAMPSWKSALSGQDTQDVLAFVLTLRK